MGEDSPGDVEASYKRVAPAVHADCVGRARQELSMKIKPGRNDVTFKAIDDLVAIAADQEEIEEIRKLLTM